MEARGYEEPAPYHVDLTFKNAEEARRLRVELMTWTPSDGWSDNADQLFRVLGGEDV